MPLATVLSISERLRYFESLRDRNERVLFAVLSILGRVDGFLDIGCGDGWNVRKAYAVAIKPSLGIESDAEICQVSSVGVTLKCCQVDRPFRATGYFDLVFCLNATKYEHLDLEELGENLINHTSRWLVCAKPWPNNIIHTLRYRTDLSSRLACAISDEYGIFERCQS
jgi:SAM-dependent methyltransferase